MRNLHKNKKLRTILLLNREIFNYKKKLEGLIKKLNFIKKILKKYIEKNIIEKIYEKYFF